MEILLHNSTVPTANYQDSQLVCEGFYGPKKLSLVGFVSLALPDVCQCVEVSWHQPLNSEVPADSLEVVFRVEGRTETGFHSMSPLL